MNPFDILKNINIDDLKQKTQNMTSEIESIVETGESGGGFVKLTLNGNFKILSIDFEDNDIIKDDLTTFKDLIIAAYNDASEKIRNQIKNKMSGMIIPGLM